MPVSAHITNHHLLVHVHDRTTGHAFTHAAVAISYAPRCVVLLPLSLPIVRMDGAGMGPTGCMP
jgi:hypothetical protein